MLNAGYNLEWFVFTHKGVTELLAPAAGGFETPVVGTGHFSYGPAGGPWAFSPHPTDIGAGILGAGSAFGNPNAPEGIQVGFVQSTGWTSLPVTGVADTNRWIIQFLAAQRSYQPGGGVQTLDVYLDGIRIGSVTPVGTNFAPYSVSGEMSPGDHTLKFQGMSVSDNTAFIDQVQARVSRRAAFVATGSVWKYKDAGANLGSAWRDAGFDDNDWTAGLGPLGYGLEGQATTLANNGQITTYFRKHFVVTNLPAFTNLSLRLLRDDSAMVYLNGTEVFRSNLPTNSPVSFDTLALTKATGIDQTVHYFTMTIPAALLIEGTNVLAAEVHQAQVGGTDLNFDLALSGLSGNGAGIPRLQPLNTGKSLTISWPGDITGFRLQSTTNLGSSATWKPVTDQLVNLGSSVGISVIPTNGCQFFRLIR
jgi:hypothetical protein